MAEIKSLKSKKKRTESSRRWLIRQLNDPFVQKAAKDGYRSRAAYKLIEVQEKFKLLKSGSLVVDLGCTPGGWLQVSRKYVGKAGKVIGLDINFMEPIPGAEFIQADFLTEEGLLKLQDVLDGRKCDIVLSDMAAPSCGMPKVDHLRIMNLLEIAYEFALNHLNEGGCFVAKVLKGGTEQELLKDMKKSFKIVEHFKPKSSRQDSAEQYVVAMDFRG